MLRRVRRGPCTRYGISNTPNSGATEVITVDGKARSTVPSFSFFSNSPSLPSWLEPNDHDLGLVAELGVRAPSRNVRPTASNSEPGVADVAELDFGLRGGGPGKKGKAGGKRQY